MLMRRDPAINVDDQDVVTPLYILLDQTNPDRAKNSAPRINAVAVTGRTVAVDLMDSIMMGSAYPDCADGGDCPNTNGSLFVPAIDEGESLTIDILATDHDSDNLFIVWGVTKEASDNARDTANLIPETTCLSRHQYIQKKAIPD